MVYSINLDRHLPAKMISVTGAKGQKQINLQLTPRTKKEQGNMRVFRIRIRKLLLAFLAGVYDYCVSGTLHGLKYVVQEGSPLRQKLLWAVILFAACITCEINIQSLYSKWISSPFVIVVDSVYTGIWEIPFPGVVICPFLHVKKSYLDLSASPNKFQMFMSSLVCEGIQNREYLLERPLEPNEMEYLYQFITNASLKCTDYIKKCTWQSATRSSLAAGLSSEECCSELFHPVLTSSGYCQAFNLMPNNGLNPDFVPWLTRIGYNASNSEKKRFQKLWSQDTGFANMDIGKEYPRRSMLTGPGYGLMVELYFNISEWQHMCDTGYQGFRLTMTSPSKDADGQSYVDIPMNRHSTINIMPSSSSTPNSMRMISSTTRKCYFQDEHPLRNYQVYSDHNCKTEWLHTNMLERCGCVPFQTPMRILTDHVTVCSTEQSADCMLQTESEVNKEVMQLYYDQKKEYTNSKVDNTDIPKSKIPICWPACNFISYTKTVFYSDFVNDKKNISDNIGLSWTTMPKDGESTRITVRFDDKLFLGLHREAQYDLKELVASIGGVLSLFLGFSLMSLIELVYCVIIKPIFTVLRPLAVAPPAPPRFLRVQPHPTFPYLP